MNLQQIILEEYNRILQEKKYPRRYRYGYSFGRLGEDPMDEKNGAMLRYGASMNKPILAFINLVLARDGADNTQSGNPIRKLSDEELDRMIAYTGGSDWSNRVNRATSNMFKVRNKDSRGHLRGPKSLGKEGKNYYERFSTKEEAIEYKNEFLLKINNME